MARKRITDENIRVLLQNDGEDERESCSEDELTFPLTMMEQMIFYFSIQKVITIAVVIRGTSTAMMVLLTKGTLTY